MGAKGEKGFQEQLSRTHGQNQGRVKSREGDGDGWGEGDWWGGNANNCT